MKILSWHTPVDIKVWARFPFSHIFLFYRLECEMDETFQWRFFETNGSPRAGSAPFLCSYRLERNGAFHLYNIFYFSRIFECTLASFTSRKAYASLLTSQIATLPPTTRCKPFQLTRKISQTKKLG